MTTDRENVVRLPRRSFDAWQDQPEPATKRCCRCMRLQPLYLYHRRSKAKDGLAAACKECRCKNTPRPPATTDGKTCSRCRLWQPFAEFQKYRRAEDGLRAACRSCRKIECAAYRANNPEKFRESIRLARLKRLDYYNQWKRDYKKRNPEQVAKDNKRYRQTEHGRARVASLISAWRARRRNVPGNYSEAEWTAQVARQKNRCAYCQRRFCKKRPPTRDHVIPLLLGGPHVASNIVAACKSCNSSKKAKRTVLL